MNALSRWLCLIFRIPARIIPAPRRRRTRLTVEACEDRTLPSRTTLLEVPRPKSVLDTAIIESPSKDLGEIKNTLGRSDDTKRIKHLERRLAKRKPPAPPILTLSENRPPEVAVSPGPPVFLAQTSSLTVSITDPDEPNDPASGYTLSINWGDGTAPTVLQQPNPFNQTVNHVYAQTGIWTVTVTGTDPHNATDTETTQLAVAQITSVVWEQIDSPLAGNTGNGWAGTAYGLQIYPDHLDPWDTVDRSRVRVVATVSPAVAGLTVYFTAVDVDDPSDYVAPLDDESDETDNRGNNGFFEYLSVVTGIDGRAETVYHVPLQPGDNEVAVASHSQQYLTTLRNVDANGDGWDVYAYSGETRGAIVPAALKTPPLTQKRVLHVEVDSMGAEPAGTQFEADDAGGDIPDPDIGFFADAFKEAFIDEIKRDTKTDAGQAADNSNLPWRYKWQNAFGQLDDQARVNYYLNATTGHRGTRNQEKATYWVVYVVSVYELIDANDNDPNTEGAGPGVTYDPEPEFSEVAEEVIRDIAQQWGWQPFMGANYVKARKLAALHEVGHQFELQHSAPDANGNPRDVMWTHTNDAGEQKIPLMQAAFSRDQIAQIRGVTTP